MADPPCARRPDPGEGSGFLPGDALGDELRVVGQAGTLTVMAGGSEEDFRRALPVLQRVGTRVTRLGPSGAGQVTKLANQQVRRVALAVDSLVKTF